jgi:pimeloyl-ACP methyl ester carboxylesterase
MRKALRRALWAGALVGAPALANAVITARAGTPTTPLPGDIGYYAWTYGRVTYYRMGAGAPLLLVHHPGVGGSAWEWRKVFPALAEHFTVYAVDLLGCGLSDHPALPYTGPLLADLVHDFLEDVVGQAASAIGSGLGAAYLVNVAVRRPQFIDKLVLVNPVGSVIMGSALLEEAAHLAMAAPVVGETVYNALTRRAALAGSLARLYYDPNAVTADMIDTVYTFAHQPGSRHAGGAYLTGGLDCPMRLAFADLTQPVMLVWSRDATHTPAADAADLVYRQPKARVEILEHCGLLPHDEAAGTFLQLTREFLIAPELGEMAA